eukprot:TRINITY_DN5542_c0_g1_i1.p1 TRINITY_DN5542_c0_g1~~TRINITY_DN5542_c0_g1_i1.p1  ORF type:complete len:696 (-),score=132.69 TRINITY_DN5542_c0_g1_i1:44-2131(-)
MEPDETEHIVDTDFILKSIFVHLKDDVESLLSCILVCIDWSDNASPFLCEVKDSVWKERAIKLYGWAVERDRENGVDIQNWGQWLKNYKTKYQDSKNSWVQFQKGSKWKMLWMNTIKTGLALYKEYQVERILYINMETCLDIKKIDKKGHFNCLQLTTLEANHTFSFAKEYERDTWLKTIDEMIKYYNPKAPEILFQLENAEKESSLSKFGKKLNKLNNTIKSTTAHIFAEPTPSIGDSVEEKKPSSSKFKMPFLGSGSSNQQHSSSDIPIIQETETDNPFDEPEDVKAPEPDQAVNKSPNSKLSTSHPEFSSIKKKEDADQNESATSESTPKKNDKKGKLETSNKGRRDRKLSESASAVSQRVKNLFGRKKEDNEAKAPELDNVAEEEEQNTNTNAAQSPSADTSHNETSEGTKESDNPFDDDVPTEQPTTTASSETTKESDNPFDDDNTVPEPQTVIKSEPEVIEEESEPPIVGPFSLDTSIFPSPNSADFTYKIVIIGNSGVGKTNLLHRWVSGEFENTSVTLSADVTVKCFQIDGKLIKVQFWDTAGQEAHFAVTQTYFRKAHGAIVVYDVTDAESFFDVQKWVTAVKDVSGNENTQFILIGNKVDLASSRQITTAVGLEYARRQSLFFLETSAKSGKNINRAFQIILQDIHNFHLSATNKESLESTGKTTVIGETASSENDSSPFSGCCN